ncbi:hypothetical protein DFH09DRAFT_96654 [Mycena vulgaris]|nr:hypothetical protein DFH09DRAFT_96654 [Mycena vulgaris]
MSAIETSTYSTHPARYPLCLICLHFVPTSASSVQLFCADPRGPAGATLFCDFQLDLTPHLLTPTKMSMGSMGFRPEPTASITFATGPLKHEDYWSYEPWLMHLAPDGHPVCSVASHNWALHPFFFALPHGVQVQILIAITRVWLQRSYILPSPGREAV